MGKSIKLAIFEVWLRITVGEKDEIILNKVSERITKLPRSYLNE